MLDTEKKNSYVRNIVECCLFCLWIFAAYLLVNSVIQSEFYNREDSVVVRVIANSNNKEDQNSKMDYIYKIFNNDELINENLTYKAGQFVMPPKFYGNQFFPQQSRYTKAYFIGDARGDNWFCVLFHNACGVKNKKQLKKVKLRLWKE